MARSQGIVGSDAVARGAGAGDFIAMAAADKDVKEAAYRLVQLSDEEYKNSIVEGSSAHEKKGLPATRVSSVSYAKVIEEIFGRDAEEDEGEVAEFREACERKEKDKKKKKQRKYRSLADIYRATKPLDNEKYFKKMKIKY